MNFSEALIENHSNLNEHSNFFFFLTLQFLSFAVGKENLTIHNEFF